MSMALELIGNAKRKMTLEGAMEIARIGLGKPRPSSTT